MALALEQVRAVDPGGDDVEEDLVGREGGVGDLGCLLYTSDAADEKAAIVAAVREHVWPLVASGAVRPIVHARMPLAQAADAHRLLESSTHIGKVLLTA